jgi:hypothetical protein
MGAGVVFFLLCFRGELAWVQAIHSEVRGGLSERFLNVFYSVARDNNS